MCNARGCRSRMHICRWITRSSTAGTGPALFLLCLLIVAAKSPRQQPSSATLLMLLEPGPRLRAELHAGLANSTVGESDSSGWVLHYLNYCHFERNRKDSKIPQPARPTVAPLLRRKKKCREKAPVLKCWRNLERNPCFSHDFNPTFEPRIF